MDKTQDRNRRIVMFVPQEIHTGGERYLVEVFDYLKHQAVPIEPIYLEHSKKGRRGVYLVIDCLLANLRFFWQVRQLGDLSNVVFFEDFHWHPRLLLCNFLLKSSARNLKIVILMQSSLFYHDICKNSLFRKLDRLAIRLFFKQANKILCNSEFTRQEVLSTGVAPCKVEVVYCGYDDELIVTQVDRKTKSKVNILFVGQCAAYKGLVYLLQAVSILSDHRFTVNIVGNTEAEPDHFKQLTRLIEELSLENLVTFHGHIKNRLKLSDYYNQADIFVLPSLVEGFAIVLLEAMSFGLPIVASRVGAVPELINDGENGLLVPSADSEELADTLKKLLDSKELRQRLGNNSRDFYQAHRGFYSWDKVGERILAAMM